MRNAPTMVSPNRKCTRLDSTLTIGRISAGNSTFLIRFPPETSDPAASFNAEENHVHGRRPQNRNNAYGSRQMTEGSGTAGHGSRGSTTPKTKEYTVSSSSGLTNDQKNPSTEPR